MAKSTKAAVRKSTSNTASTGAVGKKIAKTQIIDLVASHTTLNKKQASGAVAAMLSSVATALQEGKSVGLPGLGTLSVTQTAERTGVRPGTSQRITISAGKKIRFKVASTLKDKF